MQVLTATSKSGEDLSSWTKSSQHPQASALSLRSSQRPSASALSPSRGFPSWSRAFRHTDNIPRQVFAHYNKNGCQCWTISQKSSELAICWVVTEKLGKSVSLFLSMSKCPTPPNPPTWPGICWIALAARTPLIAPYSVLTDITAPLQLWKTISFPISYNPKILYPNLNHSQNSFPDALGSFTARGKSAERRPCQVRLFIFTTIIIIITIPALEFSAMEV